MSSSILTPMFDPAPKAILFDLIGTCTDWHSSIVPLLTSSPPIPFIPQPEISKLSSPEDQLSQFALSWREGFFAEIHARFEAGEELEDIDLTHRRFLDRLLEGRGIGLGEYGWDEKVRQRLVEGWHAQVGECNTKFSSVKRGNNVNL